MEDGTFLRRNTNTSKGAEAGKSMIPLRNGKKAKRAKGQNSIDNTTGHLSSMYSTPSSSFLAESYFSSSSYPPPQMGHVF